MGRPVVVQGDDSPLFLSPLSRWLRRGRGRCSSCGAHLETQGHKPQCGLGFNASPALGRDGRLYLHPVNLDGPPPPDGTRRLVLHPELPVMLPVPPLPSRGPCDMWTDGEGWCGDPADTRHYLAGIRCPRHSPAALAGRTDPTTFGTPAAPWLAELTSD